MKLPASPLQMAQNPATVPKSPLWMAQKMEGIQKYQAKPLTWRTPAKYPAAIPMWKTPVTMLNPIPLLMKQRPRLLMKQPPKQTAKHHTQNGKGVRLWTIC